MKKELQEKLFEKYPKIFRQKDLPMTQTCMCWGIDTGGGWHSLIDTLCGQIQHHIRWKKESYDYDLKRYNKLSEEEKETEDKPVFKPIHFEASQVKEKFGGLRFYYDGGDDYISGLVDFAESMSYNICDVCGAEGKNGCGETKWYTTRCGKHRNTGWYIDKKKDQGAVAVDFDGVINSYKSGFVAIDDIPDPPVEGAFEFIEELLNNGFKVFLYSTRFGDPRGTEAIDKWLKEYGMKNSVRNQLEYSREKPIAKVYIDDRAWEFRGVWPDIMEIAHFKPWHGGKSSSQK